MALVSQNPVLFSGSLRYNVEYGLKDCTFEKVEETAKRANADDFISKLENGYDTGTKLTKTFCHTSYVYVVDNAHQLKK